MHSLTQNRIQFQDESRLDTHFDECWIYAEHCRKWRMSTFELRMRIAFSRALELNARIRVGV